MISAGNAVGRVVESLAKLTHLQPIESGLQRLQSKDYSRLTVANLGS
jgi:hypothetical protein